MGEKKTARLLKSKLTAVFALAAAAAIAFGITWAYFSDIRSLANPLKTPNTGAAIIEEFNPASSFLPGESVTKQVYFKNTGEMKIFLRVKVNPDEGWYENYSSEVKLTDLKVDAVKKIWVNGGNAFAVNGTSTTQWIRIGNYCYYYKILEPSGTSGDSTELILDSIQLSKEISNDRHAIDYSDKVYKLTFEAEAIPVDGALFGELGGELQTGSTAEWDNVQVTVNADKTLSWQLKSE